jgi:hypothetical protein
MWLRSSTAHRGLPKRAKWSDVVLFGPVTQIALGIMTASLQHADMTRAKRGRNAKMTQRDAKNNARITRNNAGVCRSPVESGAAYSFYLKELRQDVGSNLEKHHPVLVNSNRLGGGGHPGSQSWPQPPFRRPTTFPEEEYSESVSNRRYRQSRALPHLANPPCFGNPIQPPNHE